MGKRSRHGAGNVSRSPAPEHGGDSAHTVSGSARPEAIIIGLRARAVSPIVVAQDSRVIRIGTRVGRGRRSDGPRPKARRRGYDRGTGV